MTTDVYERRQVRLPKCTSRIGVAFIASLALLVLPALTPSTASKAGADEKKSRPNFVVIMIDDARLDDVSYMPKSRRLIGDRGATFTRAYAPTPLCCPARASFLTGQYGHNSGVLSNNPKYGGFASFKDESTLATWLHPTYATAWIGKYLNGYASGSDDDKYIPPGWTHWAVPVQGVWQYKDHTMNIDGKRDRSRGVYSADLHAELTRRFIRERAGRSRPFFVVTSYLAPHTGLPREADDPRGLKTPYVERDYRDAYEGPSPKKSPAFNEKDMSDKRPSVRNNPRFTAEQKRRITEVNAQRRESLLSVDEKVRNTMRVLRAAGELDNTYVMLLSDNGYLLGEHRVQVGKKLPYEPSNHLPLMIRGPGVDEGKVGGLVGIHDLAPTILSLADLPTASGNFPVDGKKFTRLLRGRRPPDPKRSVVLEMSDNRGGYAYHGIVRQDGWKYVEFTTEGVNEVEMYDLDRDPHELRNLSDKRRYSKMRDKLDAEMRRLMDCKAGDCE
jgi:arylsulfatase A-like enzyme